MKIIRFKENPFLDDLVINKRMKTVRVNSSIGKNDNIVINQASGEIVGAYTHVSTFKEVDQSEFVKIFTDNIAMTFDLTSAGIKALNVLIYSVQKQALEKDVVALDRFALSGFLENNKMKKLRLSLPTFVRGLSELVNCKIIARHSRQGFFFINPNFVFNGDRIAFTTAVVRKNKEEIQEELKLEN